MSTGVVESPVNQVISSRFYTKPQMAWTPRGAHLLPQIRTRVVHSDWEAPCREWSPGLRVGPQPVAACPPRINRSLMVAPCVQQGR